MFRHVAEIVNRLKLDIDFLSSGNCVDYSPVNGENIASFPLGDAQTVERTVARSVAAFREWRDVSPAERSELIRLFADELSANKEDIVNLIMIETGKIRSAALKEVERSISLCESVASIPQRLSGVSAPAESHKLVISQSWLPLGPVAVVTSFNFPLRVWTLHALVALACGNSVIWRPSRKATLTAFAVISLLRRAKARCSANCPEYLSQILICDHPELMQLAKNPQVPLVCATGAPAMARKIQGLVGERLGRSILATGGNNAALVAPSADIDLAVNHIVRSTIADCGQRGTSLQRLFCHSSVYDKIVPRLKDEFRRVYVNSPFERQSMIGPLIDKVAYDTMRLSLEQATVDGGVVSGGNRLDVGNYKDAYYVQPALVEMPKQTGIVKTELLAPVLYVMRYDDFDQAMEEINAFPQTLVSCAFTNDLKEVGAFSSLDGARTNVATVNAGTVGYDLAAMFGTDRNAVGSGTASEPWRLFMQAKSCLVNFNC